MPIKDPAGAIPRSPNFQLLASHHVFLVRYATQAERYLFDDPSTALFKLRQFAEMLAQQACAYLGIATTPEDDFGKVLGFLRDSRAATTDLMDLFHGIRKAGNAAVHEGKGTRSDALHHLRMARQLAIWFHRSFGNAPSFKPGPFLPPPDPTQASAELHEELERLRQQVVEQQLQVEQVQLTAGQEAALRQQAEQRAQAAYEELNVALSLAEESDARLPQEKAQFEQQLAQVQAQMAEKPAQQVQVVVEQAQQAATLLDLDEAATRKIIDQKLRDAGWEADSEQTSFKKGVRPQKGKNLAIAEWPTSSGPADARRQEINFRYRTDDADWVYCLTLMGRVEVTAAPSFTRVRKQTKPTGTRHEHRVRLRRFVCGGHGPAREANSAKLSPYHCSP